MENTRRTPGHFQATQGEENIMDEQDRKLIEKMMEYYAGDPKRVQHFLKVYEFAKLIGESESLDTETMHILRTAAIVHDIGIKISEEKYGSSNGKYQEKEGPAVAEPMLLALGYDEAVIDRVLFHYIDCICYICFHIFYCIFCYLFLYRYIFLYSFLFQIGRAHV